MSRISRCAALALVLTGCTATVDGSDGEGGQDGTDGDDVNAPSGATGGGNEAPPGGYVGCPETGGAPAAELLHQTPWGITALLADDSGIVYATERLADYPALLVRLDPSTNEIIEEDDVADSITSLRRVGDRLYGGGYCIGGGTPYVIGDGPSFAPLANGCGGNPSSSLALVAGGVAFQRDSSVRWAAEGNPASDVLATFHEAKEGEMPPNVTVVATDGTNVFAALTYTQLGANQSWGEIWRMSVRGGEPVRLVQTTIEASFRYGGVEWMLVDGDHVYYLDHARGDLLRVHKNGGEPEAFWSGDRHIRDLVDAGTHFAFLEYGDLQECAAVVRAIPKTGGDASRLATLPHFSGGLSFGGTRLHALGWLGMEIDSQLGVFRTLPLP